MVRSAGVPNQGNPGLNPARLCRSCVTLGNFLMLSKTHMPHMREHLPHGCVLVIQGGDTCEAYYTKMQIMMLWFHPSALQNFSRAEYNLKVSSEKLSIYCMGFLPMEINKEISFLRSHKIIQRASFI